MRELFPIPRNIMGQFLTITYSDDGGLYFYWYSFYSFSYRGVRACPVRFSTLPS